MLSSLRFSKVLLRLINRRPQNLRRVASWATLRGVFDCFVCQCCPRKKKSSHESFKLCNEKGLREFIKLRRNKQVDTILVEQETRKKTLVLDLDDTLVHSSYLAEKWDFKVNVNHRYNLVCARRQRKDSLYQNPVRSQPFPEDNEFALLTNHIYRWFS